jgi:hypothetical protein
VCFVRCCSLSEAFGGSERFEHVLRLTLPPLVASAQVLDRHLAHTSLLRAQWQLRIDGLVVGLKTEVLVVVLLLSGGGRPSLRMVKGIYHDDSDSESGESSTEKPEDHEDTEDSPDSSMQGACVLGPAFALVSSSVSW